MKKHGELLIMDDEEVHFHNWLAFETGSIGFMRVNPNPIYVRATQGMIELNAQWMQRERDKETKK